MKKFSSLTAFASLPYLLASFPSTKAKQSWPFFFALDGTKAELRMSIALKGNIQIKIERNRCSTQLKKHVLTSFFSTKSKILQSFCTKEVFSLAYMKVSVVKRQCQGECPCTKSYKSCGCWLPNSCRKSASFVTSDTFRTLVLIFCSDSVMLQ